MSRSTVTRAALFVALAYTLILAVGVAMRTVGGWDVWWHLAIGRTIVEEGSWIPYEIYSFPVMGEPYEIKDIVSDSLMYWCFRTLGYPGLTVYKAVAFLLGCSGFWLALSPRNRRPLLLGLSATLYALAIQNRVVARPLMMTMAFFPILLAWFELLRREIQSDPTRRRRVALWISMVLFMLVWANLHRASLVGMVLIFGFAVWTSLSFLLKKVPRLADLTGFEGNRREQLLVWSIAIAVPIVALVNPSGANFYLTSLGVPSNEVYAEIISEWQRLSLVQAWTYFREPLVLGIAATVVLIGVYGRILLRGRKPGDPDLWLLGMLVLFGALAAGAARWYVYVGVVGVFVLTKAAEQALSRRSYFEGSKELVAVLMIGLVAAPVVFFANSHPFGNGPREERYPEQALDFARGHGLSRNVFNDFVFGGYVIWHSFPTFSPIIDGRTAAIHSTAHLARVSRAHRDPEVFEEIRSEYDLDWVLARNSPGFESFQFLSRDDQWMLVHWDSPAAVYVLRDRYPNLSNLRYRHLGVVDPAGQLRRSLMANRGNEAVIEEIGVELIRAWQAAPHDVRSNSLLALYYHWRGPAYIDRVENHLRLLREYHPEHPATLEIHRRLLNQR